MFYKEGVPLLRCTLAGMIPLMASKKYSVLTEVFYKFRRSDFDNILKSQSFYLLREIPQAIAARLLAPRIAHILALQEEDGLWPGLDRVRKTYDILSALQYTGMLDKLREEGRIKDARRTLEERYDYHSLLIKSQIFRETSYKDERAIRDMIEEIQNRQFSDGSFDHSVFATAYHMEKLSALGVTGRDLAIQKAVSFLFRNQSKHWEAQPGTKQGVYQAYVFSTGNRVLEFQSAQKYRPEMQPLRVCYSALGIVQSAYCLKMLVALGLENDARVQAAMEGILTLIEQYQGLCYREIRYRWAEKYSALALH